jgi:N-acetyl-anhydromuramyl-L-alanine amidase AmpD
VEYFIAYHYLIKEDGQIVNTRPEDCGSISVKDESINRGAIHISYTGDGKPNQAQLDSLVTLTRDIQNRYKLPRSAVTAHADIQAKNKQESME